MENSPEQDWPLTLTPQQAVDAVVQIGQELYNATGTGMTPYNSGQYPLGAQYFGQFHRHYSAHIARRDGFRYVTKPTAYHELPPFARVTGDIHLILRRKIPRDLPRLDEDALRDLHPDIYGLIQEFRGDVREYQKLEKEGHRDEPEYTHVSDRLLNKFTSIAEKLSQNGISIPIRMENERLIVQNKDNLGIFLFALEQAGLYQIDSYLIPPLVGTEIIKISGAAVAIYEKILSHFSAIPELLAQTQVAFARHYPDIIKKIREPEFIHALQMANLIDPQLTRKGLPPRYPFSKLLAMARVTEPYPEHLESLTECALVLQDIIRNHKGFFRILPHIERFEKQCEEMVKGQRQEFDGDVIKAAARGVQRTITKEIPHPDERLQTQLALLGSFIEQMPWAVRAGLSFEAIGRFLKRGVRSGRGV